MNLSFFYHRNSNLVAQDLEFIEEYEELLYALKSISDKDLIAAYEKRKKTRKGIKSLSEPINNLIKNKLKKLDWSAESGIFKEPPYNTTNVKRWRLDFAKNNIAVEVAFNHGEAIAHNIIKPVLSSELNHVKKEIQTKMGVIITATNKMKKNGNFDSAIGSFEDFQQYFKPYNSLVTTPIVLIGLNEPETFKIDPKTRIINYF
tara:strand:- start:7257 stop:7865 length:609 start_codon:yes stop_codon:yes gene_type:complete